MSMIRIEIQSKRILRDYNARTKEIKDLVASIESSKSYTYNKVKKPLSTRQEDFIKYLNDDKQKKLKWLLCSNATDIRNKVIPEVEKKFVELQKDRLSKKTKTYTYSDIYQLCDYIFIKRGYNYLSNKGQFYKASSVNVCPYCNHTDIGTIKEPDGTTTVKGDLDHFYCKSCYPYLAMSLYNLIPSCKVCNGTKRKGEKDAKIVGILNPYELPHSDGLTFYTVPTKYKPKGVSVDDRYKSIRINWKYSGIPGLSSNIKEYKLASVFRDDTFRKLAIKAKDTADKFYSRPYITNQKKMLKKNGLKPSFDLILMNELDVENDHNKYSQHCDSKFKLDILEAAITAKGTKPLI